ncbi:MAG: hypothetical protein Q7T74_06325 [Candidatus Saccharibacteria bacterium]|nr:hypothetical protein [Candidatus Saccharibacteria bacterium]
MRFELDAKSVKAIIDDPRQNTPVCLDISVLNIIPNDRLVSLLDACVRYGLGKKPVTHRNMVVGALRPFGRYLHSDVAKRSGALPADFEEWQFLALQFGLWFISHSGSNAKFDMRCTWWRKCTRPWLVFLQEEGWIPLGVVWPDLSLSAELVAFGPAARTRVVGELPNRDMEDDNFDDFLDRTIAGPIFWRTDTEYLDEIEAKVRERDKVLGEVLLDYWVKLVRDYRTGKKLLAQVSEERWESKREENWRYDKNTCLTSHRHIDGHLWALRFLRQQLTCTDDIDCLGLKALKGHPAVGWGFLKSESTTPIKPLKEMTALSNEQSALYRPRNILNRFLGVFNNTDFSVALALLIREHPNLNPSSLAGAKVINGRNQSHLIVYGESQSLIFSVDKPRAKSRKYAVLSRRASQIFEHILRATAPIRALLRRANNPRWRFLFLGDVYQGSLGHPGVIRADLLTNSSRRLGVTLVDLYPYLVDFGLVMGTVDFVKIRNTKGIIEWFDTGSLRATAKRLGNSQRTVAQYYIPESLIVAWNERIIRRFQNTILVLAAHEEEWILDVVDMPNLQELTRFLAQLVSDLPFGSSPIADRVHEFFNCNFQAEPVSIDKNHANALLHVKLSVSSLALLLAYRQWAQTNLPPDDQQQSDTSTGLAPKYFIDLAGMLQAVAQSQDIGEELREYLDVARLQRCYQQAVALVPNLVKRIKRLTIHSEKGFSS